MCYSQCYHTQYSQQCDGHSDWVNPHQHVTIYTPAPLHMITHGLDFIILLYNENNKNTRNIQTCTKQLGTDNAFSVT